MYRFWFTTVAIYLATFLALAFVLTEVRAT